MLRSHRYVSALLLAVGVATATPACAAQTYGYGNPGGRNGGYSAYGRELERRAYENGYREGVQEGRADAQRGRDLSYSRHDEYRDAGRGYRGGDGNHDVYRRSFRQGFQTGYNESYNRYARSGYGRSSPVYPTYPTASNRGSFRSPAADNGYREGFEAGRSDARDRDRYDPIRAKRYREGDHDYDGRYGSREEYKREYRAAFEQGYRDGYRRR